MNYVLPEWHPHERTWLALARSDRDYWGDKLAACQEEQLAVAAAIARFEPVILLVAPCDGHALRGRNLPNITLLPYEDYDDIWIRDYKLELFDWIPDAFAEGGAWAHNGEGIVLTTNSWLKMQDLSKFKPIPAQTMIILAGREDEFEPDTHGHIDGICFFADPQTVVFGIDEEMTPMMGENLHRILRTGFEVVTVLNSRSKYFPKDAPVDYCCEYVQGIFVNGGFIMPETDDTERNKEAKETFQILWPDREIVGVSMKTIGYKAGGIHCMTREEPQR